MVYYHMRELTFALEYQDGVDPVMDAFMEYPTLSSDSIASCVRRDRLWCIERFVGPETALDQIERLRLEADTPTEKMTETDCGAVRQHEVLERSSTTLVFYSFLKRLHTCNSVAALAARHLDLGLVFQSQRRGNCHEWRLLMPSDENVDVFSEKAQTHLDDRVRFTIGRLGDAEQLNYDSLATVSMPCEQRATLRAAIEHGYYETPREITISELAAVLDVPQSTVSYRLRQAEAQLAKGYLHRSDEEFRTQAAHST
ncbi:HTH DNA binding domain-containing protein [Natrinema hispanicum]|uniref:HTH DNA binding domain-containing protein n=2 Tax=Natrinema hispanicum TaxID=392421 RepID=A0A1I0HTU0_9EURY|nr:HTH DNA binding domain-containing protein [Natrinema hispanicum]SET87642.1 HTH DNA binding domain-containing protein [Natrinema hispanicum]